MLTATLLAFPPRTNIPRPTKKNPKDTPDRVFNKLAWHQIYGTKGVDCKFRDCVNYNKRLLTILIPESYQRSQSFSISCQIPGHIPRLRLLYTCIDINQSLIVHSRWDAYCASSDTSIATLPLACNGRGHHPSTWRLRNFVFSTKILVGNTSGVAELCLFF